ncbi:MAG: glycosyltransferase family 4 protein [Bacteroidota bacterium]|nr:glycosyltransferase family 4 protein [Bacteroidota bacterium]
MNNLFFRATLAPYRLDLYNALHTYLNMELYFYRRKDLSQDTNMELLEQQCEFTSHYLDGYELGGSSRKLCKGIYRLLKSNKPDIVIVPEFQIVAIQVWICRFLLKKKFKIVSMCDDSNDMIVNRNNFTIIHEYARRILIPLLDDIIVVEPRVRDWYQQHYTKGIWFPIIRDENKEIKDYQRVIPLSNVLNEKYNLTGKKVVLFVGRLVALKNLSRFLTAVENLKEDCAIIIVGSGEEEIPLKQQAKRINKTIIFTGRLEGDILRAWYNVSDVFVLLSVQEAFGAVTNEALLAGNYVLVSEKAGSNCLIEEHVNGYVVDPYNIDMITENLDRLLSNIKSKNEHITLKPNLMKVSFNERVNNLIKAL